MQNFLFASGLLITSVLERSLSRYEVFEAPSNIPSNKHVHARQKIGVLSVTKAIKIGAFGFQPIRGFWLKNFQNSGQCEKNRTLGDNFLVKTGVWGWCRGWKNKGSNVWQSVRTIVYMWVIPHWFSILSSWAQTWTNWQRLNLAHACLDIHGLKYMDINTAYSAPPSTLLPPLTKS